MANLWELTKQDPAVYLRSLNFGGDSQHCYPPVKTLEGTVPSCLPMIYMYATDEEDRWQIATFHKEAENSIEASK